MKYNDILNKNSFYEYYNKDEEQIGYYLNILESMFKPCYYKCKRCVEEGNDANNKCVECIDDYNYKDENRNCDIKIIETTFFKTPKIESYTLNITEVITDKIINESNVYKYLYDINPYSINLKNNFIHTFIDIAQETINFIKSEFNLKEDKIYVSITENIKNYSNMAIIDYIYEYILDNGTILNLSNIEEEDIYVPLIDLDLAKFNLAEEFAEKGYDIYDIKVIFIMIFALLPV